MIHYQCKCPIYFKYLSNYNYSILEKECKFVVTNLIGIYFWFFEKKLKTALYLCDR